MFFIQNIQHCELSNATNDTYPSPIISELRGQGEKRNEAIEETQADSRNFDRHVVISYYEITAADTARIKGGRDYLSSYCNWAFLLMGIVSNASRRLDRKMDLEVYEYTSM